MVKLPTSRMVLSRWALIGLFVLLCGPWFLPSNKLYHQLIIVLLWLPALLALLLERDFRRQIFQAEMMLFIILSGWMLLILLLKGASDPASKAKLPIYVFLSLVGIVLAARDVRWSLEVQLRVSIFVGGFLAWVSVQYFSLTGPHAPFQRLIAIGLWDTAIMAAHAVGALAVLGFLLFRDVSTRRIVYLLAVAVAAVGYVLFIGLNQSRGVWLAVMVTSLALLLSRPSRSSLTVLLVGVGMVSFVCWQAPEILMQRGLSYRPELIAGGLELLKQNWLLGLGFNPYEIVVHSASNTYKHPHNLYLDLSIRLGLPGLFLFLLLWGGVFWRGWRNRQEVMGRALLALWCFSSVALLTDGIGLWFKPNADWLITWLPIAISLVLAVRQQESRSITGISSVSLCHVRESKA